MLKKGTALLLALLLLAPLLSFAETAEEYYDTRLSQLKTPAEQGMLSGDYTLRTGNCAYVPDVAPAVTPYDQADQTVYPPVKGTFESSDESVVTVTEKGLMTGVSEGAAVVTYSAEDGDRIYFVYVSDDAMPETIKNYIYVLNREFLTVRRSKLPKYNQYAKWYYGKKKEVGWCSVFTIYCANASGNPVPKYKTVNMDNAAPVQFFAEGEVGHQYDGFHQLGRFVDVPKPGYLVIYADMSKGYRTTHIGSVTEVEEMGDGVYMLTTVEGNMSNSVKSYCYLYDSTRANNLVGDKELGAGKKLQNNMSVIPAEYQTAPEGTVQYELHTDHWSVFGFCATW